MWLGYSQTLRPVQRGVTMVVDLSATVRPRPPPNKKSFLLKRFLTVPVACGSYCTTR